MKDPHKHKPKSLKGIFDTPFQKCIGVSEPRDMVPFNHMLSGLEWGELSWF